MSNAWTVEQARKELDAWRSSGLSMDRFAKERRIAAHRLRYWKKRFEDGAVTKGKSLSLLPVRVVQVNGGPVDVVLPSGHIARVSRGFDEETLARVIAVLG
jgi:hypothetical protein